MLTKKNKLTETLRIICVVLFIIVCTTFTIITIYTLVTDKSEDFKNHIISIFSGLITLIGVYITIKYSQKTAKEKLKPYFQIHKDSTYSYKDINSLNDLRGSLYSIPAPCLLLCKKNTLNQVQNNVKQIKENDKNNRVRISSNLKYKFIRYSITLENYNFFPGFDIKVKLYKDNTEYVYYKLSHTGKYDFILELQNEDNKYDINILRHSETYLFNIVFIDTNQEKEAFKLYMDIEYKTIDLFNESLKCEIIINNNIITTKVL